MNEKGYSNVAADLRDCLADSNTEPAKKKKIENFLRTIEVGKLKDIDENIKKIGVEFIHEIILLEGRSGFSIEVMMKGGVFPKVEIGYSLAFFTILAGLMGLFNTIAKKETPSFLYPVFLGIVAFHLLAFGASSAFERYIIAPEKNSTYPGFFAKKGTNIQIDSVKEVIADLFGVWSKNEIETSETISESEDEKQFLINGPSKIQI